MLKKYQRVCAEVDLDAIHHNLEELKRHLEPNVQMMAIIKANGYGHGALPIAWELEEIPYIFGYGVATAEEAFQLQKSGLKKPVLVLGYTFPDNYNELIQREIRMTVFRRDTLKELALSGAELFKKAKIHIKIDTGMSRVGILPDDDGLDFIREALSYEWIEVEGVFTHLARADEKDITFSKEQINQISQFYGRIEKELRYQIPVKHCFNSAGILQLWNTDFNVARAGIAMYGLYPSDEIAEKCTGLEPALSLKSHIVYIKEVEQGVPISYGGTYVTKKPMIVATIPVGYGDGYPRSLSNKGYVLIHGKAAPILGRVCMDQFMVSLEDIPEARMGDEVTLIGKDGDALITMEELGTLSGRFNYEFACDLSERVPRVYKKNGKILET